MDLTHFLDFDAATILQGYANGYFLMAEEPEQALGWYSSWERALIPLDDRFCYPRSLQRAINQNRFTSRIDSAFDAVLEGCADRESTWISAELMQIYRHLHQQGWAHSFETWEGEKLAGGILGIVIGGAFIGESMFYRIPEGSKVAMVKLVEHLRSQGFSLFDAQILNPHLERFGAYTISHTDYLTLLQAAIQQPVSFLPASRLKG